MTPLKRVTTDALEQWIAHLCNIDAARNRAWITQHEPERLAKFDADMKQRRADLAIAKRAVQKHRPHSPMLDYDID